MSKSCSFHKLNSPEYGRPASKQHAALQGLTVPHVDSFNYMLQTGLTNAVKDVRPAEFRLPNGDKVSISILEADISNPQVPPGTAHARTLKIFPAECRQRGVTYKGQLRANVCVTVNSQLEDQTVRALGDVPVMVKSAACNLNNLSPAELIRRGEEAEEMGGYFIVNGIERIIRQLIMPRRNFPMCLCRNSWKSRGTHYTEYGVMMRSVGKAQQGVNNVLHYLSTGSAVLNINYNKEMFFVPIVLILKGLLDVSDKHIYTELMRGKEDNAFYKGCIVSMLRQLLGEGLTTRSAVLKYLGERFRVRLPIADWYTDEEAGTMLLKECVCIHLDRNEDKFNLLVYMTKKLFAFAKGECAAESADNPMNQEVLLAGHLYLMVLMEKLEVWLQHVRTSIEKYAKTHKAGEMEFKLNPKIIAQSCKHAADLSRSIEYFLSTGNLVSRSGHGLLQVAGYTVVADKLNFFRYLSHFRCIHRGGYFTQMRTTSVRKLLPEAWGFLCPVHTPDGTPCGLLNHMTALCQLQTAIFRTEHMIPLLTSLGMVPIGDSLLHSFNSYYTVFMDGRILGYVLQTEAREVCDSLREMKVKGLRKVPVTMEICLVPKTEFASQYPGIFLFTTPARMLRPVLNLTHNRTEVIGTFEQVYMDICIVKSEAIPGVTTHQEISEISMLSTLATLTPFSDFNQSPRNMYQCQMAKQTMGFPCHALKYRSDNKLYKLQTPQTPVVRPAKYDYYNMDNYPLGTNAIVAVISYTGFDMEDAMVLNKSSYERGFAHASIYKTEFIDLKNISGEKHNVSLIFGCKPNDALVTNGSLDPDGFPPVGTYLMEGQPYYSYINVYTGEMKVVKYRSQEPAYLDQVRLLGDSQGQGELQKVSVVLRIQRNPTVGDKFSSRHGQKGVCSILWPVEDMPFSESGMTPDIIFNPHGYPSRMTIGMMIESMAGKSAASHGLCHDATPFQFSEDDPAIDHYGKMLVAAGYNYYGTERMYSGVDGRELEADIFVGVIYYQRLRHMVSDKFQVRTTGPIDILTHQPIKGRKRAGGIRFGEMERDALISHGSSFLLQDRLLNCSDRSVAHICTTCGSLLSPLMDRPPSEEAAASYEIKRKYHCAMCKENGKILIAPVPYVFRYLVAELAAMSIRVVLKVT